MHDINRDQFYLKEFIAPIMPVAMLLAAAYVIGLGVFFRITRAPDSLALTLAELGGGVALLVLAGACRCLARKGAFHATAMVGILFGGIFATTVCIRAWVNEDGLLTVLPVCMMLITLGSVFAQRIWHLLAAFAATMTPAVFLAIRVDSAVSPEGRYYPQVVIFTLLTVVSFFYLIRIIKERYYAALAEQLERATRDPLTSLLNRCAWDKRADGLLRQPRDPSASLALLFLDVDHFKCVNDRVGHAMGDHVLMRVATLLRQAFGPEALIARYGGEEFVVLLQEREQHEAYARAEQLREALAAEPVPDLAVTLSIGIALHEPDEALNALLLRADRALLRAKARGRDRIELAPGSAESPRTFPQAAMAASREPSIERGMPLPALQPREA